MLPFPNSPDPEKVKKILFFTFKGKKTLIFRYIGRGTDATVLVHCLGTLTYLGQSAIFKTAKKSLTWDTGHGTFSDFGGILARRRRVFVSFASLK